MGDDKKGKPITVFGQKLHKIEMRSVPKQEMSFFDDHQIKVVKSPEGKYESVIVKKDKDA